MYDILCQAILSLRVTILFLFVRLGESFLVNKVGYSSYSFVTVLNLFLHKKRSFYFTDF